MTDDALANALLAWSTSVLTEIVGKFDHQPLRHNQGLPELGVGILRRQLSPSMEGAGPSLQQQLFDIRTCELVIAVKPEPAEQAIGTLRGFVDRLLASVRSDRTLGKRVEVVSPLVTVDYDPGEIRFADDTEARGFTLNLTVGERVSHP